MKSENGTKKGRKKQLFIGNTMGYLKWYKRDPRAALHGMMELTLEERGAYTTVLDLIYTHDGAVDDNPQFIASWLRVDVRVWKRLRATLLGAGKLYIHNNQIRNQRADLETDMALHRVTSATEAAMKRWATYNEIKRLRDAPAMLSTTTKTNLISYLGRKPKK